MTTVQQLRDRVLRAQIDVVGRLTEFRDRSRAAVQRLVAGERGQTPTEYLMIVGFMAVVIIFVFVVWYWDNIKTAAQNWSKNVQNSVSGGTVGK